MRGKHCIYISSIELRARLIGRVLKSSVVAEHIATNAYRELVRSIMFANTDKSSGALVDDNNNEFGDCTLYAEQNLN